MSEKELSWLPGRQNEEIEEALGEIFKAAEKGIHETVKIRELLGQEVGPGTYETILKGKFILEEKGRVELTQTGNLLAKSVIRRCRLSERLLADVLGVQPEQVSAAACQWEHILSREITDSICTLLGHPTECPHENAIPSGDCCQKSEPVAHAVVIPLSKMESRHEARISYLLFKRNPEVYRLMSLGLVPGQKVKLLQRFPNFVLEIEENQIALDETLAKDIYVRPL